MADEIYIPPHIPDGVVPVDGGNYPLDPSDGTYYPESGYSIPSPEGCCPHDNDYLLFAGYCANNSTGNWSSWRLTPVDYEFDPTFGESYNEVCSTYSHHYIIQQSTIVDYAAVEFRNDGTEYREIRVTHAEWVKNHCMHDIVYESDLPPDCRNSPEGYTLKYIVYDDIVTYNSYSGYFYLLSDLISSARNGTWTTALDYSNGTFT